MKVRELKLGQVYADVFDERLRMVRGGFLNLFKVGVKTIRIDNGDMKIIKFPVYDGQFIKHISEPTPREKHSK